MACLPWLSFTINTFPGLFQVIYLVLFLHPAKRKTAFVRVNIEIQLLLKKLYEWRTLVSNLCRDKPTCSFAQSHFLIYISEGFIVYCCTVISWGRREKTHNPDHQDCLGQCLHCLLHNKSVRLITVCSPGTFSWFHLLYGTVSSDRFCATSLSDIQLLHSFMDVSISGISYQDRHTQTNQQTAQKTPKIASSCWRPSLHFLMTTRASCLFYVQTSEGSKEVQSRKFCLLTTSLFTGLQKVVKLNKFRNHEELCTTVKNH